MRTGFEPERDFDPYTSLWNATQNLLAPLRLLAFDLRDETEAAPEVEGTEGTVAEASACTSDYFMLSQWIPDLSCRMSDKNWKRAPHP